MRKKAQEMKSKISAPKNTIQKIKLIMNVITPDNYDRKREELRNYLFGDQYKTNDECFDQEIDYDESVHMLTEDSMN